MIYWMKGEKFIEELAGHIREGEIRYRSQLVDFYLLSLCLISKPCSLKLPTIPFSNI
jgi:interleukin 1 receptor accessory protein-like